MSSSAAASSHTAQELPDIQTMKVKDLKHELASYGRCAVSMIEKSEFVAAVETERTKRGLQSVKREPAAAAAAAEQQHSQQQQGWAERKEQQQQQQQQDSSSNSSTQSPRKSTVSPGDDISNMSIKELKRELGNYGVSTVTMVEKSEFISALEKKRAEHERGQQQQQQQHDPSGVQPREEEDARAQEVRQGRESRKDFQEGAASMPQEGEDRGEAYSPAASASAQASAPASAWASQPTTSSTTPPDTTPEIAAMSIKDLKQELERCGISTDTMLEKSDLKRAVMSARDSEGRTETKAAAPVAAEEAPRQEQQEHNKPEGAANIFPPSLWPRQEQRQNKPDVAASIFSPSLSESFSEAQPPEVTNTAAAAKPPSTDNTPPDAIPKIAAMSIKDLKQELERCGISTDTMLEKSDLKRAVMSARDSDEGRTKGRSAAEPVAAEEAPRQEEQEHNKPDGAAQPVSSIFPPSLSPTRQEQGQNMPAAAAAGIFSSESFSEDHPTGVTDTAAAAKPLPTDHVPEEEGVPNESESTPYPPAHSMPSDADRCYGDDDGQEDIPEAPPEDTFTPWTPGGGPMGGDAGAGLHNVGELPYSGCGADGTGGDTAPVGAQPIYGGTSRAARRSGARRKVVKASSDNGNDVSGSRGAVGMNNTVSSTKRVDAYACSSAKEDPLVSTCSMRTLGSGSMKTDVVDNTSRSTTSSAARTEAAERPGWLPTEVEFKAHNKKQEIDQQPKRKSSRRLLPRRSRPAVDR